MFTACSLWYKAPTMLPAGDQLSEIINKIAIVASGWLFILFNADMFMCPDTTVIFDMRCSR